MLLQLSIRASTQCTHPNVPPPHGRTHRGTQIPHAHTLTHTHTQDSPAASPSSSLEPDQPSPYLAPEATRVGANTPSVQSPSGCLPEARAVGGGTWSRAPVPEPSAHCPGSRLDRCPHCDGCLGGLQEAEPFVLSERNHDNHPMRSPLVLLPLHPFPPAFSGAQGKAGGHLAASANPCWADGKDLASENRSAAALPWGQGPPPGDSALCRACLALGPL